MYRFQSEFDKVALTSALNDRIILTYYEDISAVKEYSKYKSGLKMMWCNKNVLEILQYLLIMFPS